MKNKFESNNPLESQSEKVIIQFRADRKIQRFIEAKDENENIYILSYPEVKRHAEIVDMASQELGKNFQASGGGFLQVIRDELSVSGESIDYGKFNKERVIALLKEAYPNLIIEYSEI